MEKKIEDIKDFIIDYLEKKGFETAKLKIEVGLLRPIATSGEGYKSSEYWSGLYNIICKNDDIFLYTYKQKEDICYLEKLPFKSDVFDNKNNLGGVKVKENNELKKVMDFINKNSGVDAPKIIENHKIDGFDKNSNDVKRVKTFDDLFKSLDSIALNSDKNILKGLDQIDSDTVRVVNDDIEIEGFKGKISHGDLIIRYSDNLLGSFVYGIKNLEDSIYMENWHTVNLDELNYKLLGGEVKSSDDWVCIADDFLSGLSIYRDLKIKTLIIPNNNEKKLNEVKQQLKSINSKIKALVFNNLEHVEGISAEQFIYEKGNGFTYLYINGKYDTWAKYKDSMPQIEEPKKIMKNLIERSIEIFKSGSI